jgi:hypothetical protein
MPSRLITLDEVLAEASSIISDASEQEKVFMRQWVYRAQRQIGFSKIDIKVSDALVLDDFSVAKPADMVSIIDLALFTGDGSEIKINYKGWGKNQALLPEGGSARVHQDLRRVVNAINVTEDIDYIHTESFSEGNAGTAYIIAKYYALPMDSTGLPMIPEENTFAIMMFIRWMWIMRQNSQSIAAIAEAKRTWKEERIAAKSRTNTPSVLEGKEEAKKLNSMIQKAVLTYRQF